jgi:hypothetical protein
LRVAAPAAEACIALSLLLLAADVLQKKRTEARSAALTALIFGSVHGLGFAGGLRELGLPDQHVAVALLGFGAGVELGQVAFLALAVLLVRAICKFQIGRRAISLSNLAAGGAAAYWLIARLAVCLDL